MTITLTRDAFNAIMRTCKDVAKGSHYVGLDRDTLRLICRDSRVTAVALNNASIVEVTVPCEQPSDDGEMLVPVLKLAGKNELIVSISHALCMFRSASAASGNHRNEGNRHQQRAD